MNRRSFLVGGCIAAGAAAAAVFLMRRRPAERTTEVSTDKEMRVSERVVIVCVDRAGRYSPGVYLQAGGSLNALSTIPLAAPSMRSSEVGDAAAGLCGYLYKQLGDAVAADGLLSLYDAPKVVGTEPVDWQGYCGWNVDVVLVHIESGVAELYAGGEDPSRQKNCWCRH